MILKWKELFFLCLKGHFLVHHWFDHSTFWHYLEKNKSTNICDLLCFIDYFTFEIYELIYTIRVFHCEKCCIECVAI